MVQPTITPPSPERGSVPFPESMTAENLIHELGLSDRLLPGIQQAARDWPMRVPKSLLNRIEYGNVNDPVLIQFLPDPAELVPVPGFTEDPLLEGEQTTPGLLRKYAGRALVLTSHLCFARCRYCFRRHARANDSLFTNHAKEEAFLPDFSRFFKSIAGDTSIHELILSGGEPLAASNNELKHLFHYIKSLQHVNRVRIHSRAAILAPERIDPDLLHILSNWLQEEGDKNNSLFFVFHVNHSNELDSSVFRMFDQLRALGVILLSQSVLLKRVNDSADVLTELFEKLTAHGVLPYYLHQLDRVSGAAPFEVTEEKGRELIDELRGRLPGYAVPRYVRETPGSNSKTCL